MASPPDNDPTKPGEPNSAIKRRATDTFKGAQANPNEVTTTTPAYSDDITTTTPAVGDDVLGPGPLDAGRSEPSSPNAVVGPITKRRMRTSPYQEASGELKLDDLEKERKKQEKLAEKEAKKEAKRAEKAAKAAKALEPKDPNAPKEAKAPKEPKKKKSLPRRILKGFLWTVAILILLVGAVVAFLHTGPGKSVAKGFVEGALNKRYDGKVTIGDLDYALGGDVEITDLVIAEHSGREVVHLHHLLLTLDWGSLLSKPLTIEKLAIDGLTLDLVTFADGTSNLRRMQKEPTKLPDAIVLQALEVSDVDVSLERPDGSKIKVDDLGLVASLSMDGPAETLALKLDKLSGKVTTPTVFAGFTIAADMKRNGQDVEGTIDPKALDVVLTRPGEAPRSVPLVIKPVKLAMKDGAVEMTFGGLTAGPLTIAGMRTLGRLPPPGQVGLPGLGPGEHLLELTGMKIDHKGVNELLAREALLSDVTIDASVKGPAERLLVDGKVATDGGVLTMNGTVDARDMLKPIVHLVLEGKAIDTTKILGGEKRPDLQTSFKATIDLEGLPPNHVLKLHADVEKTTVRGRTIDSVVIDVSGKGDLLILDGMEIVAFGQALKLDGQFDRASREFRGGLRMVTVLADAIQKARDAGVLITPLPPIAGTLDVDLGVAGKLKAPPVVVAGAEVPPAQPFDPKALIVNGRIDLSSLPIENLTINGKIQGKDVVVKGAPGTALPDRKVGLVDVDLDMLVEGGKPDGIKGQLVAKVGGVDTGKTTLDSGEVKVVFEGLQQDITIRARDEKQALALDVAMRSLLDLEKRHVDTTITQLDVKRGPAETHLEAPVTLQIDSTPEGKQSVKLPPMKLALAGGTLDLAVQAQLSKDEANPGANKIDHFDVSLDLEGIDVGRLAALAQRSTRGLSGKLDANVKAQGTKENPQLDFFGSLRGRMKTGAPFTAKFDGALRDKKLDLELEVTDRGSRSPIFLLDVMAPLNLPTTPGAKPSLGAGRFSIKADLPNTTLSRLGALLPNGVPPNLDPDANIGFGLELGGTVQKPTGEWHLDFEGDILRRRGYEQAPARQKVAIKGQMRPEGVQTALDNDFDFHLDANGAAYVQHHTAATFSRSPLTKGFMDRPWTIDAGLEKPLDLSALSDLGIAKKPLQGQLASGMNLNGQGPDVLGVISFGLADVKYGTAPVANIAGAITIGPDDIRITNKVNAAGLDAVAIDIGVGVPGKGLRHVLKDRQRLMQAPVSGEIRLVEHAIAEWRRALEGQAKVPDLPGNVGGALMLGGNLTTPTAKGAFAWDGFDTTSGAPGRVAFEIDAGVERAAGGLAIGAQREVTIFGSVARADLKPPPAGVTPGPLEIDLAMKAERVDLLKLVPAFATAGKPWKVKGILDWSMNGKVFRSRDPENPGNNGSYLLGDLVVSALDIEVPDTDRHIQDGKLAFTATREALEISGIELYEGRLPALPGLNVTEDKGNRWVRITGRAPWTDLRPSDVTLDIKTFDWLILGLGFDGPEGELDIDMHVVAKDLGAPVKTIDVAILGLELYSPDRFIRAHYPQFPAYDDVVYLDVSGKPAGVLPPGKGYVAPPDPTAPPPPPPDPSTGFDVHLGIPNEIHVVFSGNSPLEIKLKGAMDVTMRGSDLNLKGRLDVTDGVLGAMGRDFRLMTGAITADGGLDTAKAEMLFGIHPHDIALRDVAKGKHDDFSTITVRATAKTGLQTVFGGVSGPYLLDMATLLNTGRARQWGLPDVPASETIRFGNVDHGLVLTFIQTNLRNLVFMDRMNGWSESLEEPDEYGRIRFFDMQRFVGDGGARVHFLAQPVDIGQNRMELSYDWLFVNTPNTVFGFGPHLGTDSRAGVGFSLEWASED